MSGPVFEQEEVVLSKEKENGSGGEVLSYLARKRRDALSLCRILYGKDAHCHCWECGEGWNEVLADLSYELEFMNRTEGRRFGMKVVADQVKEKFGTLRFYYSAVLARPWWTKAFSFPFSGLAKVLRKNVDFGYKKDGWKRIPTRHLLLFSFVGFLEKAARFLDLSFLYDRIVDDPVFRMHFENRIDSLIAKAERDCFDRCEICGTNIGGDGWERKCVTKGWIRYVCGKCAEKNGLPFEEVDQT